MADITMSLDDTLELDAIIQEWDDPDNIVNDNNNKFNLSGIQTSTRILDPKESGEHTITVNGQKLTVKVTDPSTIPESGVSNYRFEQNVLDKWGDNDGSLSEASYTTTSKEGNYSLDVGTDTNHYYADISDSNSLDLNNWSISCWVYFNGFADETNGLVVKGPQEAGKVNYELRASSGGLDACFGDGTNFYSDTKSTTINTGEWIHCVGTYDGSSLIAYVNGSSSSGESVSGTPNTNSDNLIIGKEFDNDSDRAHNGYIDDVKIYNKALTSSEVSNLYQSSSI